MRQMTIQEALRKVSELMQAGNLAQAESLCREILQIDPAAHPALYLLGAMLLQRGESAAAAEMLARAMNLAPAMPVYQSAYGTALVSQRRYAEAAEAYRRALHHAPRLASAHRGLGRALIQLDEAESALQSFTKAMELGAPRAETLADLALAQRSLGKNDEAVVSANEAIALRPDFAWGQYVMGLLQLDGENYESAVASFKRAVELNANLSDARNNLGKCYRLTGQFKKAFDTVQELINRSPDFVEAYTNLGCTFGEVGLIDEAISAFRSALQLDNTLSGTHANLLLAMTFSDRFTPPEVADEHRRWGMMHAPSTAPPLSLRRLVAGEPLRVGYVSGDLRRHPVAYFFEPILKNHDPQMVLSFIYSDVDRGDDVTARLKQMAPRWIDVFGNSDEIFEKAVRSDQIDILVDLGGHTDQNRLQAFAKRLAPVQVTYLGYPNTTGITAMDFILTDSWADPPGNEAWHTEKLIRLPRCFLCYNPPADAPAVKPNSEPHQIVFGAFNRFSKLTDTTLGLWAKVLQATPGSRLMLKDVGLADPAIMQIWRERIQKFGIDLNRVDLGPRMRHLDYLATHNSIDIALDTFPFNGATVTCEALWMGVPVVTLVGQAHASRVCYSILSAIGHPELAGQTPEQFVQIAADLAADHARCLQLRQNLRQEMSQSPLMHGPGMARAVEIAYRQMWAERSQT
jgi:predicted O-linked N-acetylglucosamine transferase (SPINDLY family)